MIVDRLFGVPLEFYYAIALAALVWYLLEYTALGRRILFVGRGRDVASSAASIPIASASPAWPSPASSARSPACSTLARRARRIRCPAVTYQLPAFAAAFLGSTCIAPGRFNPWGATVAVYFLVTGITGLVFLGFSSFIQEMFYGGALVVAVTLSQLVRGRQEQQF